MGQPICIVIENKQGTRVTVPLLTWENGLKLDTDWHIYEPPKAKPQPVAPVKVKLLPPPVAPVAPPVVAHKKPGRKPKGK